MTCLEEQDSRRIVAGKIWEDIGTELAGQAARTRTNRHKNMVFFLTKEEGSFGRPFPREWELHERAGSLHPKNVTTLRH